MIYVPHIYHKQINKIHVDRFSIYTFNRPMDGVGGHGPASLELVGLTKWHEEWQRLPFQKEIDI